jgi:hypothetical protein
MEAMDDRSNDFTQIAEDIADVTIAGYVIHSAPQLLVLGYHL